MTLVSRHWRALALAAVVGIVFAALHANVARLDTTIIIAVYSLLALSVGLSYGQVGVLSVAQAAFASIGAYASAILTVRHELPLIAGFAAAVVLPAIVAYPLARVVTRLSPLALAIATLVFGQALDIGLRQGGDFTGGYIGLSGIPPLPFARDPAAFYLVAWAAVVFVVVLYENLCGTAFGRAVVTIRSDPLRATADGINVAHLRSTMLSLSAAVAGVAGFLYAHYVSYLGPDSLGPNLSLSILLMAVVGGVQTILGPILGAALLTFLYSFIPSAEAQGMFYGAVLIAMLILAPAGILGLPLRSCLGRAGRCKKPPSPKRSAAEDFAAERVS